jgi:hypothetical protein
MHHPDQLRRRERYRPDSWLKAPLDINEVINEVLALGAA